MNDKRLELLRQRVEDVIPKDSKVDKDTKLHEILVYQAELEAQFNELIQAELELDKNNKRLEHIFELAPLGLIVIDNQERIIRINQTGIKHLALSTSDYQKTRLLTAIKDSTAVRLLLSWLSNHEEKSITIKVGQKSVQQWLEWKKIDRNQSETLLSVDDVTQKKLSKLESVQQQQIEQKRRVSSNSALVKFHSKLITHLHEGDRLVEKLDAQNASKNDIENFVLCYKRLSHCIMEYFQHEDKKEDNNIEQTSLPSVLSDQEMKGPFLTPNHNSDIIRASLTHKIILVIDHNPLSIINITQALEPYSAEVFHIDRFDNIAEILALKTPELIIVNMSIPPLDARQIISQLHQTEFQKTVIGIASEPHIKNKELYFSLGYACLLSKPLQMADLTNGLSLLGYEINH